MNWNDIVANLNLPPLRVGNHSSPEHGVCAMEMVAFIERLPHSDSPECTCPVIAAFVRTANDRLLDDERQKLLPILPELVGSVSPEHETERVRHFVLLASRIWAPRALRKAGVDESLIAALEQAETYQEIERAANAASDAARYAAWAAANAASDAANAAENAARDAAENAARDAASAAAWSTAEAAGAGLANEYIQAIRGALAIGPESKGFTSLDRVPELVAIGERR